MNEKDIELWEQDIELIKMLREKNEELEQKIKKALEFIESVQHYNVIPYELYEILKK